MCHLVMRCVAAQSAGLARAGGVATASASEDALAAGFMAVFRYVPVFGTIVPNYGTYVVRPLDALFSPVEQRLMGLVLTHPDRDFGTLELLKHMGSSRSSGSNVLGRWVASGLLRERRVGNQRRLSANRDFLLFPELRKIVVKTVGLAEPLCAALEPIAASLSEAFIFGSVATGSDTSESDIDVALVGDVDLFTVSPLIDQAEQVLGRRVHVNIYGQEEWSAEGDSVLAKIKHGPRLDLMETLRGQTR